MKIFGHFILCGIMVAKSYGYNNDARLDWEDNAEFGRAKVSHKPYQDSELAFRELLQSQIVEMSMSLSMSYSYTHNANVITSSPSKNPSMAPTTMSPSTKLPTTLVPTDTDTEDSSTKNASFQNSCDDEQQAMIGIQLEVDTAPNKTSFEADLSTALVIALSEEFTTCGSRRLENSGSPIHNDFQLGDISVIEESNESCLPNSELIADSCHVVRAEIIVAGEIDSASRVLRETFEIIFMNHTAFTNDLPLKGVIEVRLKDQYKADAVNTMPTVYGSSNSERSTVIAILSAAGGTILATIIIRNVKRRNSDTDKDSQSEIESDGDTTSNSNAVGIAV